MSTPSIKSITIIGTGRVAHHLCYVFATNGLIIAEVVGRNMLKAIDLAKLCGAKPVGKLEQVSQDADLYVIAVSDDAIEEVINSLPSLDGLVVHTSGMKSQQVFERNFARFGIFYPLQTFSFERKPDFSTIPVFVQSNSDEDTQLLWALGKMILSEVHVISDTQRQRLHLAAVFVNNFSNAMYSIADEILTAEGLSFNALKPLLMETALKALQMPPREAQTGPARRNDQGTLKQHFQLLQQHPDFQKVYQTMTDYILNHFHNK